METLLVIQQKITFLTQSLNERANFLIKNDPTTQNFIGQIGRDNKKRDLVIANQQAEINELKNQIRLLAERN